MPKLDFTALNNLAYRGFETAEAREQKDALIEQGFTIAEADTDNPFLQADNTAAQTASEPPKTSPVKDIDSARGQASERKKTAFMSASGTRNYRTLYRVAHDYHIRHNPPTVDREYWQTHTPGEDAPSPLELEYWTEAAKDISATAEAYDNDHFLTGLLIAVYDELEREYQDLQQKAHSMASEAV